MEKLDAFLKQAAKKGADTKEAKTNLGSVKRVLDNFESMKGQQNEKVLKSILGIARVRFEWAVRECKRLKTKKATNVKTATNSTVPKDKVWEKIKKKNLSEENRKELLAELRDSKTPYLVLQRADEMVKASADYSKYVYPIRKPGGRIDKKTLEQMLLKTYKDTASRMDLKYQVKLSLRVSVSIRGKINLMIITGGPKGYLENREFHVEIAKCLARYVFPDSQKGKSGEGTITFSSKGVHFRFGNSLFR